MELTNETFRREIDAAMLSYDRHVVCIFKTPDDCLEAIERLTVDATPEIKDPERVLDALTEPNRLKDERMGYMLSKRIPRGKTVVLTVYWAAELGLAPAAADLVVDLCEWLRTKAGLNEEVIEATLPKLRAEQVTTKEFK